MRYRRVQSWLFSSSLLLAASGVTEIARAAGPAQPVATDSDLLKVAREQFAEALALQTAGDWAGALTLLNQVAAVRPTPQVRFNIALCEERLGRLVAALGDYQLAAADAEMQNAELVQKEVEARLSALNARIPRVVLKRGSGAEAATIALDGVVLGDSVVNQPLPVDPGPHLVEASAPGYVPFRQTLRLAEQQTQTIVMNLEPVPRKPEPLPPPRPDEVVTLPALRTAGYVVGGAGIASLIASGAMFYLRHGAIHDLDQQCGESRAACPEIARSTADRGKLYTTLGNVTFAAGAAGVGVGAVLVIVGGHAKRRAPIGVAAGAPLADAGGVSLVGRF